MKLKLGYINCDFRKCESKLVIVIKKLRIINCDCEFLFTDMNVEGARKYCMPIQRSANGFTCHFCDWKMKGDGITRTKYHLSGNDPNKNARACTKVLPGV